MKIKLLYAFILVALPLHSQQDTVKISEIIIRSKQIPSDIPGFKRIEIDSAIQDKYGHLSFSELLSECTPVFIKSYGYGGAATSSFRGAGASHTRMTWNGININSPMLGQSDFSLITPGMSDNITLSYGGASIIDGPGGFGGTINLGNKPVWSETSGLYLNTGAGSFGRYSGSLKFRTGNESFQTVTRLYMNSSENNFPYMNEVAGNDRVRETRKNSQLTQRSFLQELYYRKASGVLSALIWYNSTSRNLPGSMLVVQSGPDEKQYDESLRSFLGYDLKKGNMNFFVHGAWMAARLDYTSLKASINSRNLANTFTLDGGFETMIKNHSKIKLAISDELSFIQSNNYNNNISYNSTSLTLSARSKINNRIGTTFLIREIIDGQILLIPDFSSGFEYRLFAGEEHFFKTGLTRNSRIPSLNDRYWSPGGNSNLKNEYAWQYEAGFKTSRGFTNSLSADAEITFYTNFIRDMIQWKPGEFAYWTAENIGKVNSSGMESIFSVKYETDPLNIRLNAGYSYTKSVSRNQTDAPGQLMYIPENQANSTIHVSYGDLYMFWITDFTGKRYITADNSGYLPAYFLNNVIIGLKPDLWKKISADINFRTENLFNKSYQTIAYHPQPGRAFFISLSVRIIK